MAAGDPPSKKFGTPKRVFQFFLESVPGFLSLFLPQVVVVINSIGSSPHLSLLFLEPPRLASPPGILSTFFSRAAIPFSRLQYNLPSEPVYY